MVTVPRPATVVVAAVLAFLDAALLLVGLVGVLFALGRLSLSRPGALQGSTLAGLLGAAVLLPVALATVQVFAAVGVLRGRRAARVVLSAVAGLVVVQGVIGIVNAFQRPVGLSPLVGVSLGLSVAVLVLLWLPASRPWFARPLR